MADVLDDIRERREYTNSQWYDSRAQAETDMQFVSGDPWDADDKFQRKNRPTIAPEEMGQYFNQVINQLWANPRGMKFAPRGGGASEAGARFYQNKAREIEYRSHAKVAYITAASDAIQRSYGFVRVTARYASPRSANQELWIEAVPDPNMVCPDPDAKSPDSSDQQFCFVDEWRDQAAFKKSYPRAKLKNVSDWASTHPSWIQGQKVLISEYWEVATRPRRLFLVQSTATEMPQQRMIAPSPQAMPRPVEMFEDEVPRGSNVIRELRMVDFPTVKMYLTNGVEILHEQDWPGKYIPIVSCYGKVLYVPTGGETKRVLLSMTRFGRAPWKAMCYAASQELEVLSMIPKSPFMVPKGTFAGPLGMAVQESMHVPKAYLEYDDSPTGQSGQKNGAPQPVNYPVGQHLSALEITKESWRRSIQAAMGSNFLPTQAQKRNEKSGVALDKIAQAASTGTFHFVNNYEDMIRQVAVITEDLIDKYYDFAGETAVMDADHTAQTVQINSDQPEAVSTKGDYLVTVSTGPSSDSEREAVQDFAESLVQNIDKIAGIAGPKAAAAVFAKAIRLRSGGPEMDGLADLIEPPEFKKQDGQEKAPDPELLALQGQLQQMQQKLQEAGQIIETEQVKTEGQMRLEQEKAAGQMRLKAMELDFQKLKLDVESETKMSVAAIGAKVDRMAMLIEQQQRLAEHVHEVGMAAAQAKHDLGMSIADAQHEALMADRGHEQAMEQADQGLAGQMAMQEPDGDEASV